MGWKAIKEHFDIKHNVYVTDSGICIGSAYVHNIIVIAADGTISSSMERNGHFGNADLDRYWKAMSADPAKVKELIESEDHFDKSIVVYTYDGGEILKKKCEATGWPNVTHDGEMMYENTFSTDRAEVIKWAKRNAKLGVENLVERLKDHEAKAKKLRERLMEWEENVTKLDRIK